MAATLDGLSVYSWSLSVGTEAGYGLGQAPSAACTEHLMVTGICSSEAGMLDCEELNLKQVLRIWLRKMKTGQGRPSNCRAFIHLKILQQTTFFRA